MLSRISSFLVAAALALTAAGAARGATWPVGGQNLQNTRSQPREHAISPANVGQLVPKWVFRTGGDVSATPAVDDKAVYFPDFSGNLYKLDRDNGRVLWARRIEEYNGIAGSFSRTTPALAGDLLVIGDQNGAHVMAIKRKTGALVWIRQVEEHRNAIVTQSPVVFFDTVYVGVSSNEELVAVSPGVCCTFRGSVVALDVATGAIRWKTYTAPPGYSGNAVWGSTPVVDAARGSLYVTTGNNYTVPADVRLCIATATTPEQKLACQDPRNFFDSIVALDLADGAIKWGRRALPADVFPPPSDDGPDFDFGSGPNLFTAGGRQLLGAGQKSGIYWALDPATGEVVWSTQVGPGGLLGGIQWGSAIGDGRVYIAIANSFHQPVVLRSGATTIGGFWSALDAATGAIVWQTADPAFAVDTGMVSTANGVVYAGSMDAVGHMYAFDGATGAVRFSFVAGGSVNAGPAIADGSVYWGSGYRTGTPNDKFYAFTLPRKAD